MKNVSKVRLLKLMKDQMRHELQVDHLKRKLATENEENQRLHLEMSELIQENEDNAECILALRKSSSLLHNEMFAELLEEKRRLEVEVTTLRHSNKLLEDDLCTLKEFYANIFKDIEKDQFKGFDNLIQNLEISLQAKDIELNECKASNVNIQLDLETLQLRMDQLVKSELLAIEQKKQIQEYAEKVLKLDEENMNLRIERNNLESQLKVYSI